MIPHDVERFVTESCAPYMQAIYASGEEQLPVLRLTGHYTVRVQQAQLHCRPVP